jgi:hypothetical protein
MVSSVSLQTAIIPRSLTLLHSKTQIQLPRMSKIVSCVKMLVMIFTQLMPMFNNVRFRRSLAIATALASSMPLYSDYYYHL